MGGRVSSIEITNIEEQELQSYIEVPPNSDLGDYAFPCFKLAKTLRKSPPIIAQEINNCFKFPAF